MGIIYIVCWQPGGMVTYKTYNMFGIVSFPEEVEVAYRKEYSLSEPVLAALVSFPLLHPSQTGLNNPLNPANIWLLCTM